VSGEFSRFTSDLKDQVPDENPIDALRRSVICLRSIQVRPANGIGQRARGGSATAVDMCIRASLRKRRWRLGGRVNMLLNLASGALQAQAIHPSREYGKVVSSRVSRAASGSPVCRLRRVQCQNGLAHRQRRYRRSFGVLACRSPRGSGRAVELFSVTSVCYRRSARWFRLPAPTEAACPDAIDFSLATGTDQYFCKRRGAVPVRARRVREITASCNRATLGGSHVGN